jgi:hypothetical protein
MRIALVGLCSAALLLGGCLSLQEQANQTASQRQIVCIDGVEYIAIPLKSSWAMAPHYKADGTLYTCANSVPRSY